MNTTTPDRDALLEQVRARYAAAATAAGSGLTAACCEPGDAVPETTSTACCGSAGDPNDDPSTSCCEPAASGNRSNGCCGPAAAEAGPDFGAALYSVHDRDGVPPAAALASLGCGNPPAVAALREGETVLDLGSGGGIDVLLSARRVGPTGMVYGLDMTDEMLTLGRRNAADAGVAHVVFLKGQIEAVPLPAASVDVVISNCVVNLSVDKPAVFAEMHRVLRPGGRVGVSDVVAEDRLTPDERKARGDYVGCIAGALSHGEYRDGLATAGFADVEIVFTHEVTDGLHGAIVRARKPG